MTSTIEEELPRFLDGPKFVEWLQDNEWTYFYRLDEIQKKNWTNWTKGTHRPDVYSPTLDQLMLNIGLPLRMIPDYLWHENQKPSPGNGGGRLPT